MDNNIIETMIILFVLVIVGFIANKLGYTDNKFDKSLSRIVFDITCPALILSSVMGEALPNRNLILPLLGVGFATYLLLTPLCYVYGRIVGKNRDEKGILAFMGMFGNVGFIGYPIVTALFGAHAVFYAAILNFPNTLFVFTIGVIMVAGKNGNNLFNWKILFSPGLVCSYIAILIVAMGWNGIPLVISKPVSLIGNITVPGAMIVVGSQMAQIPAKKILGNFRVYSAVAMRLLIVPILFWTLFHFVGVDPLINNVNTAVIAMPVASLATIMCLKYDKDMTTVSSATFWSCAFSIITIPVLSVLLFS